MTLKILLAVLIWTLVGVCYLVWNFADAKTSGKKISVVKWAIDIIFMAPIIPLAYLFGLTLHCKFKPVQYIFGWIYLAIVFPIAWLVDKIQKR